jgi:hypothetical protein
VSPVLVSAAVLGLPIGIVSRLVDTAPWAPPWIGNILSPWLATAWLVGAAVAGSRWIGMAAGVAVLLGVTVAYLALSGTDMARLFVPLAALTLLGGAVWGVAGAEWRSEGLRRVLSGAILVAAVLVDVVTILSA